MNAARIETKIAFISASGAFEERGDGLACSLQGQPKKINGQEKRSLDGKHQQPIISSREEQIVVALKMLRTATRLAKFKGASTQSWQAISSTPSSVSVAPLRMAQEVDPRRVIRSILDRMPIYPQTCSRLMPSYPKSQRDPKGLYGRP